MAQYREWQGEQNHYAQSAPQQHYQQQDYQDFSHHGHGGQSAYPEQYSHVQSYQHYEGQHQQQQYGAADEPVQDYEDAVEFTDIPDLDMHHDTSGVDKKFAQVFIRESPELLSRSLFEFRALTSQDVPELICLQHLRHRKFNVHSAVEIYRANQAFRLERGFPPQFVFAQLEPIFRRGFYTPCGRDKNGRQILYVRPRFVDAANWPHFLQVIWCVLEGCLRDELTQQRGFMVIVDGRGAAKENFSRDFAQNMMKSYQSLIPCRVGGVFMCHQPSFFKILYAVFSLFMKAKTKRRFVLLGPNTPKLLDYATSENLPVEIGGSGDYTSPAAYDRYCDFRRRMDFHPIYF